MKVSVKLFFVLALLNMGVNHAAAERAQPTKALFTATRAVKAEAGRQLASLNQDVPTAMPGGVGDEIIEGALHGDRPQHQRRQFPQLGLCRNLHARGAFDRALRQLRQVHALRCFTRLIAREIVDGAA